MGFILRVVVISCCAPNVVQRAPKNVANDKSNNNNNRSYKTTFYAWPYHNVVIVVG